jgi:Flp pilus assembly protein TadG
MAATAQFRRGTVLVYACIALVLFCACVSFAVDFGRVQLAKTEMRRNADAAARAAVAKLSNGVTAAQDAAINVASLNKIDGVALTLDRTGDIDFGTWDTSNKTFTPLTGSSQSSANAVRVWARRTTATGNPVQLNFARALGKPTFDVETFAIAFSMPQYGLVGLNSVTISGSGNTDSYNSNSSAYPPVTSGHKGTIASNGSINLSGSSTVDGDVYLPAGKTPSKSGGSTIYGTTKVLSTSMTYPTPTLPSSYINLGAVNVSGGTYTVPGGDYYASSASFSGGTVIYLQGPVRLYVGGSFTMSGGSTLRTYQNKAANFQLYMLSSSAVNLTGQADFYGQIYAPLSAITQSGGADIYGSMIGKTLNFSGSWQGGVHFDEALNASGGQIQLVR